MNGSVSVGVTTQRSENPLARKTLGADLGGSAEHDDLAVVSLGIAIPGTMSHVQIKPLDGLD
jgi:hypothetical protein